MSDDIDAYLGFACFTLLLLYMLLLYAQTRGQPQSLLSGEHRITRFEAVLSRILSVATWPVIVAFACVALRDESAHFMNFLRDPWNPDPAFVVGFLLHGWKLALCAVLLVLRGISLSAYSLRRGLSG